VEIESELSKGRRTEKKVIEAYNEVIHEFGVTAVLISQMVKYDQVKEKCGLSVSHIRCIISKYLRGEIKP
jgi:hypothetical protein